MALELPERTLIHGGCRLDHPERPRGPLPGNDLGGAAHAAEHASIGLLPLFATCDRWDVGGLSTELHPATGQLTVFVYDGHAGGAGLRGTRLRRRPAWLQATRDAIAPAPAKQAAPPASNPPNAATATTPSQRRAQSPSWTFSWRKRTKPHETSGGLARV